MRRLSSAVFVKELIVVFIILGAFVLLKEWDSIKLFVTGAVLGMMLETMALLLGFRSYFASSIWMKMLIWGHIALEDGAFVGIAGFIVLTAWFRRKYWLEKLVAALLFLAGILVVLPAVFGF